jgi:predicted TIM-barrel fold metal-dependent hydrolase
MIDSHIHFCDRRRFAELERFCDRMGLSHAGLISLPDFHRGTYNDEVRYALRQNPGRYAGFGCLDYRHDAAVDSDFARQVEQLHADGFVGLKLWIGKPSVERLFGITLWDERVGEALEAAGDFQMPVLVHVADPPDFWVSGAVYAQGYESFESYLERFERLVAEHPRVWFLGAHLLFLGGGGPRELQRILQSHPNLLVDTAPGRWFYKVLHDHFQDSQELFTTCKAQILLGSDAMFFSAEDGLFPYMDEDQNATTLSRIQDFLTKTDNWFEDPYPRVVHPGGRGPWKLRTLGLPPEVSRAVCELNAKSLLRLS